MPPLLLYEEECQIVGDEIFGSVLFLRIFSNGVVGKGKISIAQTIISCEKLGIQFENCYRNEVMGSKNRSDSKGRSVLSMNDFYETKIRFDLR